MAIAFVSSTSATIGTAASTWSIQMPATPTGGAGLVLGLGPASSAVTISAVSDNTTNVWKLAVERDTPKPAAGAALWYCTNISSASTRVSVTLSGNSSGSLALGQWTGISTNNALLQTGSSAITANSTNHGASEITPSTTNSLVVSFCRLNASTLGAITNLGGMTSWTSTSATGVVRTHGMYIIQGAASTATGSFQTSSLALHAAVIAAFSDTAAPVGGQKGLRRPLSGVGW
jgi:hypothetical protein